MTLLVTHTNSLNSFGTRKNCTKNGDNKKNRIRSQQIRESYDIQPINECVEIRRREWDENVTRMDVKRLVNISRDNIPAGRSPFENKIGRPNIWLKQSEPPIIIRRYKLYKNKYLGNHLHGL